METKANYVAVGAFTLGLFLAAAAFVYWVARVDTGGDTARLDVIIEGSVTGLGVGSFVKFNGIDVGKVTALRLDSENPGVVIAETRVSRSLPVTSSTRALLASTGLTGIAHVELEGGNLEEPTVFELAEQTEGPAIIRADPSALNNLLATADDILGRAENIVIELEGFVREARGPLNQTLQNAETFSRSLADNSDAINEFLAGVGGIGQTLEGVSGRLDSVLASIDGLVQAVEPERVQSIMTNVETFTGGLDQVSQDVRELTGTANNLLAEFSGTGEQLDRSLERIDSILANVEPGSVGQTIEDITAATASAREASANIAELADSVAGRSGDIDQVITDVAQMAERLNAASVRVDGVLAKLDSFLGEGDAGTLLADASETLASFRQVADTLNSRLDGITSGLERFSTRGLRDVEALVSDTRRSIGRIESAISNLEDNPQRLLFGGEGDVKRFDGRARR